MVPSLLKFRSKRVFPSSRIAFMFLMQLIGGASIPEHMGDVRPGPDHDGDAHDPQERREERKRPEQPIHQE